MPKSMPIGGSLQELTKANPYVYSDNDPVNEVDHSGKDPAPGECFAAILYAFFLDAPSLLGVAGVVVALGLALGEIPILSGAVALLGAYVITDIGIFLYNNDVAPHCGWNTLHTYLHLFS